MGLLLVVGCRKPTAENPVVITYAGHASFDDGTVLLGKPSMLSTFCSGQHKCTEMSVCASDPDASGAIVQVPPHSNQKSLIVIEHGKARKLTLHMSVVDFNDLAISPDCQHIGFMGHGARDPLPQIWMIDADGEELRQLTKPQVTGQWAAYPKWTADSRSLVYLRAAAASGGIATTIVKLSLSSDTSTDLREISPAVSVATAHNSSDRLALWNKEGLLVEGGLDHSIWVRSDWLGDRKILGNAISFDRTDRGVFFGVSSKTGEAQLFYTTEHSPPKLLWTRKNTIIVAIDGL